MTPVPARRGHLPATAPKTRTPYQTEFIMRAIAMSERQEQKKQCGRTGDREAGVEKGGGHSVEGGGEEEEDAQPMRPCDLGLLDDTGRRGADDLAAVDDDDDDDDAYSADGFEDESVEFA